MLVARILGKEHDAAKFIVFCLELDIKRSVLRVISAAARSLPLTVYFFGRSDAPYWHCYDEKRGEPCVKRVEGTRGWQKLGDVKLMRVQKSFATFSEFPMPLEQGTIIERGTRTVHALYFFLPGAHIPNLGDVDWFMWMHCKNVIRHAPEAIKKIKKEIQEHVPQFSDYQAVQVAMELDLF